MSTKPPAAHTQSFSSYVAPPNLVIFSGVFGHCLCCGLKPGVPALIQVSLNCTSVGGCDMNRRQIATHCRQPIESFALDPSVFAVKLLAVWSEAAHYVPVPDGQKRVG